MADKKFFKSIKRRRMINITKYMYIYVPSKKTDKYNNRLVDKNLQRRITTSEGLIFCDMKFSNTSS